MRRSHSEGGKSVSQVASPVIRCCFQVCMARSAKFRRWLCGRTPWKVMLYFRKDFFKRSKHSLLMMWRSGVYLLSLSQSNQFFQVSAIDLAYHFFCGIDMTALESQSQELNT